MVVNDSEFPVVVQAFQTSGDQELFVAEQVVNNQREVDHFTSRYAGMLIKARKLNEAEVTNEERHERQYRQKRRSGSGAVWGVVLLLLIALVVVGFTTGWIQDTFNIDTTAEPIQNAPASNT